MPIGGSINYTYLYRYLRLLDYVDGDGAGQGASFYGNFNGHITMYSRHREHRLIAKAQGNNRCPGRWLSRLSAPTTAAERSAWMFFSIFLFRLVVLCVVLCFCGIQKLFINQYPLFNTRKLGLHPSCALKWRANVVVLDSSYNLVS